MVLTATLSAQLTEKATSAEVKALLVKIEAREREEKIKDLRPLVTQLEAFAKKNEEEAKELLAPLAYLFGKKGKGKKSVSVSDDDKAKVLAKSTNENSTAKELAERTQLDIATVRVAITKLVDEGKLTKQKGQGQKPTKLAK